MEIAINNFNPQAEIFLRFQVILRWSVISVSESKSHEHFATSVQLFSDFRCVLNAANKSAWVRLATVSLNTQCLLLAWGWWELFVTSVKPSCVMAVSACQLMPAVARWRMQCALNAKETLTATVEGFICARSATRISAKTTSSNIKRLVKFSSRKATSVSRATKWDNIHV